MADLTNLIEDIRTTLAFSNLASPDKLPDYARQYAEECTKLNERLKQCLPHLRDGNIAEAVRLAGTPSPNVTETFNLLDFENRPDWIDVCESLGLDLPPPLAVGIFQELNDAYLQMASLEPLLKWHRLFARNASPLRDRLTVLRSIAKADSTNTHWQTDQETFEWARIKELGQEIADALAKKDMLQMQELYRELTASGWRIAPPAEYRQKICTAVLEKYADELLRLFSAFDYDSAAAVHQSMQRILSANQMTMPKAIEKNIRAAVQWVQATANEKRDFKQFQEALEELREALDDDSPRQTLENLYFALKNTANQGGQSIPEDLELHYRNRVKDMAKGEQYRDGMTIAAIVGALMLVAALFLYAFIR
jgi:hypothetical protein